MFNKEALPYIGAFTLIMGFESQAYFKTAANFLKDEIGYDNEKGEISRKNGSDLARGFCWGRRAR
ncbi:MAG: hypothetical protein LBG16_03255 [Elusimicrobiota bacterium]|jgi:hypothetical protein|nr:hypothetical protein [Elusimicrobiota bacterium]